MFVLTQNTRTIQVVFWWESAEGTFSLTEQSILCVGVCFDYIWADVKSIRMLDHTASSLLACSWLNKHIGGRYF